MDTPVEQIQQRKYKVFISYRHADNTEQGRQWASWLHQMLETYDIPADLISKINTHGENIPERIFPVFRDEEELSADANLASSIITALDHSEHLIVICSPRAVESAYVAEEIRYFKQIGKGNNIIAMMIDGEPNSEVFECFPQPLKFDTRSDGQLVKAQAEPIAADFRIQTPQGIAEQGWTTAAAYRQSLEENSNLRGKQIASRVDAYQKQHELMKLKIISGVLDVPLGELSKRDHAWQMELAEKKARTLRRWLTTVALLALLAIGGGIFAWLQKQEAVRQEQIATRNLSLQLTTKALDDLKEARVEEGLAGLIQSLDAWPENRTSRDRLLFELAYRDWLELEKTYPLLPGLQAVPDIRIGSDMTGGKFGFDIESADHQGSLQLTQNWQIETENEQHEILRQADWNGDRWQVQHPTSRTPEFQYGTLIRLPNDAIVESIPNSEVPLGESDISYRIGDQHQRLDATGLIALSPSKKTLAVAGFYPDQQGYDTLHIRFFGADSLEEIPSDQAIAVVPGSDVHTLLWQGNQLVLTSRTPGRRHERIDIFQVEESAQAVKLQTQALNRIIPGKQWDYHEGKLYVLNNSSLSVYRPRPALMRHWSAAPYQNHQWQRLNWLDEEDYSFNAWKKLGTTHAASGLAAQIKEKRSVVLLSSEGKGLRTIELNDPSNTGYIEYRGMGFSPNGKILTAVALDNEGEGITYSSWETWNPQTGLEVFPHSSRLDSVSGPAMLQAFFQALQLEAWSQDGKAIRLSEWDNSAYPLTDENGNTTTPLPDFWLTDPQNQKRHFILPLVWTEHAVPKWFLDIASQLIHLQHDAVRGIEYVQPEIGRSFNIRAENAISQHAGKEGEQDYVEFLKQLMGTTGQ